MPRGISKSGMRLTKQRIAAGWKKDKNGNVIAPKGFRSGTAPKATYAVTAKQEFAEPTVQMTDEQIRAKLTNTFKAMDKMADATMSGTNKSFIISGPPGLGKSYGVMDIAVKYEMKGKTVVVVKGFVRPTGLYKVLYENRSKNSVVIFDDADSVFADENALNLLKCACDMTRKRELHWLAETNMKDEFEQPLPTKFEFEGSIIFITNKDFDAIIAKGGRNAEHFEAMISRSIYLDLDIKTRRDYMVRIQMVVDSGMLKDHGLSDFDAKELISFIDKNTEKLRELSLRMVIKLASLMRMDRNDWQNLAAATCFVGTGRYQH